MGIQELMRSVFRGTAVLLVAAVPVIAGCGDFFIPVCQENNDCTTTTTTTTPTSSRTAQNSLVYTASAISGSVSGFSVGSGAVTPVTSPVTTPTGAPTAVSATPNGNVLLAATASGSIFAYTIASSGSLQLGNNGNPVAVVSKPTSMSMDRTGSLLFVLSTSSPQLQIFQINSSTGQLKKTAQGVVALDSGQPAQVFITPDNQHLFIALGTGGVDAFSLNASAGTVANRVHLASLKPGKNQDSALTSDSASQYLYVAESGAGIRVLAIGTGGTLTEISGSPFASQPAAPSSLYVDSANQTLYAAYPASKLIAGYTIGSGGGLTPVSTTPFSPDSSPTALSVDASGQYLLAVSSSRVSSPQLFSFEKAVPGELEAVSRTGAVSTVATAAP